MTDVKENSENSKLSSVRLVSLHSDPNKRYRRTMEDGHIISDNFNSDPNQGLFGVFDGHGGDGIVNFLVSNFEPIFLEVLNNPSASSKQRRPSLLNCFKARKETELFTEENFAQCFQLCHDRAVEAGKTKSGSTVAISIIKTDEKNRKFLYSANAGDSRMVLCREGAPIRMSKDHTATDPEEAQRIQKAGGFIQREKILGLVAVARGIGDNNMKKYVITTPFVKKIELQIHDKFLIIACDGVWDVFSDEDAVKCVLDGLAKGECTEETSAKYLCNKALELGSTDNITVMIVFP